MAEHPLVERVARELYAADEWLYPWDKNSYRQKPYLEKSRLAVSTIIDWLDEQGYQAVRDDLTQAIID